MLVRSQDMLSIVDAVEITVSNDLGKKKFYLYAYSNATSTAAATQLAIYPSAERAKSELDDICRFFSENTIGVYQVK